MLANMLGKVGASLMRVAEPEPMCILNIALSFKPEGTMVEASLVLERDAPGNAPCWHLPLADFRVEQDYVVPSAMVQLVGARLPASSTVVWLRLVRPYGFLGLVPWEAGLGAALDRPLLRIPAFPARVAERTDVFENVIIVDPPSDPQLAGEIRTRLRALLSAILAGSSRGDTHVHVFCSARWFGLLHGEAGDERVRFYAPVASGQHGLPANRTDLMLWTTWILGCLAGRGIDAVHLLGRAAMGEAEGCYLLSCTPFEAHGLIPDIEVDLESMGFLLSRAGAWSVSFMPAAPEFRNSVAYLADGLAHRWHGAVLFHAGTGGDDLKEAARLMFAVGATTPPRFSDGFLYCHPAFLCRKQAPLAAALAPILEHQAALLAVRAPATERIVSWVTNVLPGVNQVQQSAPPSWLGATQRFMESEVFDGLRRAAPDVLMREAAPPQLEFKTGTEDVLAQMRSVVERYLVQEREEKSDAPPISHS